MRSIYLLLFFFVSINNSSGQFEHQILQDENFYLDLIQDCVFGDLDGDGDLDVVAITRTNKRVVWLENYEGTFFYNEDFLISNNGRGFDIKTVDIDGDGDLDIVYAYSEFDRVIWHENTNGKGQFGEGKVVSSENDFAKETASYDLDEDGDLDIVVASTADGKLAWYENTDGSGDFDNEVVLGVYENLRNLKVVDLDSDGHLDIIGVSSSNIFVHKGLGEGAFSNDQNITSSFFGANDVLIADYDEDGNKDIIVFTITSSEDKLWLLRSNGSIYITEEIDDKEVRLLREADINMDGHQDIIAGLTSNALSIYTNDGSGTFGQLSLPSAEIFTLLGMDIGDFDNDGDMDILTNTSNSIFLYEQGPAGFLPPREISPNFTSAVGSISTNNLFLDGKPIISVTGVNHQYDEVSGLVIPNSEKGSFGTFGDIDDDGDMDRLTSSSKSINILRNENGSYVTSQELELETWTPSRIRFDDLDSDGDLDIIFRHSSHYKWSENLDGFGTYGEVESLISDVFFNSSFVLEDMDGDGDIDIVGAAKQTSKLCWYENLDGKTEFANRVIIAESAYHSVSCRDIDNDGDQDVIYIYASQGGIQIFLNSGNGEFSSGTNITYSGIESMKFNDMDLDGDLDIIAIADNAQMLTWFENKNLNFNTRHVIWDAPGEGSSFSVFDIDEDGDMDVFSRQDDSKTIRWHKNTSSLTNNVSGNILTALENGECKEVDYLKPLYINGTRDNLYSPSTTLLSDSEGTFNMDLNIGTFDVSLSNALPSYMGADPENTTYTFQDGGTLENTEICITSEQSIRQVSGQILPTLQTGSSTNEFFIAFQNNGTETIDANIKLVYPSSHINYESSDLQLISQIGDTLVFDYKDLRPLENNGFLVRFEELTPLEDFHEITLDITLDGDYSPEDNTNTLFLSRVEKEVVNGIAGLGKDVIALSDAQEYIDYQIYFTNTLDHPVQSLVVLDQLDENIKIETIDILGSSHSFEISANGQYLEFSSTDNFLPDDQGYIFYRISSNDAIAENQVLRNRTNIFFDGVSIGTSLKKLTILPFCPGEDLMLNGSNEVSLFVQQYPNCTVINGNLNISGSSINFEQLLQVNRIEGDLTISNSEIISGLQEFIDNLEFLGGRLILKDSSLPESLNIQRSTIIEGSIIIDNCQGITNLIIDQEDYAISETAGSEGLQVINNPDLTTCAIDIGVSTTWVSQFLISNNSNLSELNILEDLKFTNLAGILIKNNTNLRYISGLEDMIRIQGSLEITNNGAFAGFNTFPLFNSLLSVRGDLIIDMTLDNASFYSFITLNNVRKNMSLSLTGVTQLSAFGSLEEISGDLTIYESQSIDSYNAFKSLEMVEGRLSYYGQGATPSEGLTFPELIEVGSLAISGNIFSENAELFSNINEIQSLFIEDTELQSISGLSGLSLNNIDTLILRNNGQLDMCNNENICGLLADIQNETVIIENNSPGCNSIDEIKAICFVNTEEVSSNAISIAPNPASDNIHLQVDPSIQDFEIEILNNQGRLMFANKNNVHIDIIDFDAGYYILKLKSDHGLFRTVLIKL